MRRRIGDTSAALFRCIIPNLTAPCSFNASLASHLCLALTQCAAPLPDAFPIVAGTLFSVTFQRPTYCSTLHLRTLWPSPHARPMVSRFSSAATCFQGTVRIAIPSAYFGLVCSFRASLAVAVSGCLLISYKACMARRCGRVMQI